MHSKQGAGEEYFKKWTDRITNDEIFHRTKEERLRFKILKNRRHSLMGHTIRHNEFLKEQYPEKMPWEDLDYST
jgi:hypothetical protein